jgi:hypothetical protein
VANTIKLKNSGTSTNVPSSLEHGELAINYADGKIFYKDSTNTIVHVKDVAISDAAPSSPVEGDMWFESDTADFHIYYDGVWVDVGGSSVANISVGSSPPTSTPVNGDLWFDSDTAKTYIYYNDGTSSQWIEVGAVSAAASGTDGAVQFASGGSFASDASNLVWDDTNNRLGIGTTSPKQTLHVISDGGNLSSSSVSEETKGTIHLENSGGAKADGALSTGVSFSGTATGRRRALIAAFQDGADGDPHGLQFFTYGATNSSSDAVASRMTIDSSGNVGIGTTAPISPLHINGAGNLLSLQSTGTSDRSTIKFLTNGSDWEIGARGSAATPSNTLYIYDNDSSAYRMVIDTSGNVGIGTTTPAYTLDVDGTARFSGTIVADGNQISMPNTTSRNKYRLWSSDLYTIGFDSGYTFGALNDYAMTFQMNSDNDRGWWWGDTSHTNAQGAMSLTTAGQLVVASGIRVGYGESDTSAPAGGLQVGGYALISRAGGSGFTLIVENSSPVGAGVVRGIQVELGPNGNEDYTDSGDDFIRFITSNNQEIGGIRGTGAASVSYGTTSDYRLKAPIAEIEDGLTKVRQLAPMYGKWIGQNDPNRIYSYFIAHELQEHIPDAVNGDRDEVDEEGNPEYQSVDYGKLTPTLVAAIKDLDALVGALTSRIEALEGN